MAADPYDLDEMPATDENGIPYALVFDSPAEYAAWCERHPEQAAQLVDGEEEGRRRWEAWRAAETRGCLRAPSARATTSASAVF